MTENFGSGVSRTLSALARQFSTVVWQQGKPPLDSEFNLMSQVTWENLSQLIRSQAPSGFFTNPLRPQDDFIFNKQWANFFKIGQNVTGELDPTIFANVNGWILPITGTRLTDTSNKIALEPPPTSGERIDFVFLEVWRTLIAPNPSTLNKPNATELWTYGNVEYGGVNLVDDLEDPAVGFETTERVQLQYRLRVYGSGNAVATSDLYTYPDGLDDPNILGQGTAASPIGGYTFTNMKDALGDPSLWRAGNGDAASRTDLGSVDGYVYAIPVCAIFRRNSDNFSAVDFSGGNPNENGGSNRTPSSTLLPDPRDGAVVLSDATLAAVLDATTTGVVNANGLVGSGLDDSALFPGTQYLVIGEGLDQEIVGVTAVDGPGGNFTISTRGNGQTMAKRHPANTPIKFYNSRPDNLYSDEIATQDVLDLRRSVSLGEWDYQQLLFNALSSLAKNELKSAFKKAGTGAENAGPVTTEVSYMNGGGGAIPNHMDEVDAPDGVRTVWSDAAAIQSDLTNLIDDQAPLNADNFTSTTWDVTTASTWTVSTPFVPNGFLNNTGGAGSGFRNGSSFFLHIGGNNGSEGARAGLYTSNNKTVRFISPQEFWKGKGELSQQHPFRLRFLEEESMRPAALGETLSEHPGPMYPLEIENFEKPFIVLGGNLNTSLNVVGLAASAGGIGNNLHNNTSSGGTFEINVGFDFDLAGNFYPTGDLKSLDPSSVTFPLLRGQKTLFDMLTKGGLDQSGNSSELYIVVYGDPNSQNNNGAFQVIGAGTVGYTSSSASQATNLAVRPLNQDFTSFDNNPANSVNIQFRSQYMNAEDGDGRVSGNSAAVVVLTDIEGVSGGSDNPWNATNLGSPIVQPIQQKFVLDSTIQWHPSHAAFARIPDDLIRFSIKSGGGVYLRDQLSDVDPTFQTNTGNPNDERFYDFSHIQTWNRLPSLGQDAPNSSNYGDNIVGFTEQDRESELFIDKGSKTIVFRPFMDRSMLYQTQQSGATPSLIGGLTYVVPPNDPKDALNLFTANKTLAFFVPPEYMPRFGRQDIPYHNSVPGSLFLSGINHLFNDQTDPTQTVFNIIGGQDNTTGGNQVTSLLITTEPVGGATYTQSSLLGVSPTPCYIGRNFFSKRIVSSDLGVGMHGVELPPYLGIARLYGVYEYNDFINNAVTNPGTGESGFSPDRTTPAPNLTNLLRTHATKQTLFIRQDGAEDFTTEKGDHTYIVPESAIDISLIPTYTGAEEFTDFTYVVECVVFGFAKNFINENNIVLCRNHNGAGTLRPDNTDFEITDVKMVLPSAADNKNPMYGAMNRTVYQGDPYMTRNGALIQPTDYQNRYAQILNTDAYYLNYTIQQFDNSGNMVVQRPNPRSFEVLASADFYTTVGTGKIGGQMYPGTVLDIGYTDTVAGALNRIPTSQTEPEWRVLQRAFTEGQKDNPEKAGLVIHLLDTDKINATTDSLEVTIQKADGVEIEYTGHTVTSPIANRFIGINTIDLARDLTDLINDGKKASGTVEIVSPIVLADGDTISIGGYDFTARNVPVLSRDFLLVGNAIATAAQLANKVTTYFSDLEVRPTLRASSGGTNIVTIIPIKGGAFGNTIALATSNPAAVTLSGATLTGGTDSAVADTVKAVWAYDRVCLQAVPAGLAGTQIKVSLRRVPSGLVGVGTPIPVIECAQIEDKKGNSLYPAQAEVSVVTSAFLVGAEDSFVNGGNGDSPINIVGFTERLPLGILVSDSDFLFEDPLSDSGSFMKITSGSIRPVFEDLPLTTGGDEYTRFLGAPGELLAMSDGSILEYQPKNPDAIPIPFLVGAESFRLYRGGGASFMLSGKNPGGPLNWLIDSLAPGSKPVLKGAVLACKALLVRNFKEVAFEGVGSSTRTTGDEIQMVVLTHAVYGNGNSTKTGVALEGQVSPTGYGEGFAAVDRYRLPARPMRHGRLRETPDPTQDPAPIIKPNS